MRSIANINRRTFGTSLGLAVAAPALIGLTTGLSTGAVAQSAPTPGPTSGNEAWKQLNELRGRARGLGVGSPRMTLAPTGGEAEEALQAVLDLLDRLDAALDKQTTPELESLRKDTAKLRLKLNNDLKGGRSEANPQGPGAERGLAITSEETKFQKYKDQYVELFNTCVIKADKEREVSRTVARVLADKNQAAYKAVEDELCIPWFFVGIAHNLEGNNDLKAHLHNGDPLDERTVQVPAGRPKIWLPPSDWNTSALDAMRYQHFDNRMDWTLARILYRLEAYNGFGYHTKGINSPYLWSYSNHYSQGKYVSDGNYDPQAVSKQCGAAIMLKFLANNNVVQLTA